uniref:Uncharacterized protein n=1 Tax=Anguilla anguilla TaxID=7936 RepID=A0A0E9UGC4_ANGAN
MHNCDFIAQDIERFNWLSAHILSLSSDPCWFIRCL